VTALLVVTLLCVNKLLAVDQAAVEQQAAIEAAYSQTGFSPDGVTATVKDEALSVADNLPFINATGQAVWRITLNGIKIAVRKEGKIITNDKIQSIDVFLDKGSLQIIKVTTNTSSIPDAIYYNYDTPAYRTREFENDGFISMDIPQQKPAITLATALQSAEDGLGGVSLTPQFDAIYVECTKKTYTSEPDDKITPTVTAPMRRWFITLKYLPPTPITKPIIRSSHPSPTYAPARYATVVDEINADTGEWVGAAQTQISDDFLPK